MSTPTRPDKRMDARAIVAQLRDGMTIGFAVKSTHFYL